MCQSGQLGAHVDAPFDSPELHILGVYEASANHNVAGSAMVHIDRQGPVVLVLSSYEAVQWTVTAAQGTTIEQVFLNGYEKHTADVPQGTEVIDKSGNGNYYVSHAYAWDANAMTLATSVEQATGLELSSFHGCYRAVDFTLGVK
jgi:hypothetical protein